MSVVNNKHVILREDVNQYADVAFANAIENIAKNSKCEESKVIEIFLSNKDIELNKLVKKLVNDFLDNLVIELNNLIKENEEVAEDH